MSQTFFTTPYTSQDAAKVNFMATMSMQVEPKIVFTPQGCDFYTILTLMTSQVAILVQRAMLKIKSNFFHNSIHIIGCFQVQFYGNHVHVGGA